MYYLYILRCANNSLYTGITNNLKARMEAHRAGTGSKYVRAHLPFQVVYTEEFANRSDAQKREAFVKKMSKADKELLCKTS
ncbi:MAG: GIY-YIG nuclease family protein [Candidatus Dojkabacteria bacterium]|nr:MAG: GIY-YIG nuclease family protein [Candidatus Dojkabacteria bacterium]